MKNFDKNITKSKASSLLTPILLIFLLPSIILVCVCPFVYAANSSYTSTLEFDSTLIGKSRTYEGQNIAISMKTFLVKKAPMYAYSNNISVTLYRNDGLIKSKSGLVAKNQKRCSE
jgi:hypothetical protein